MLPKPAIIFASIIVMVAALHAVPPAIKDDTLKGMEGLVAEPLMAPNFLPNRIMGVGVAPDGMVFVTETGRYGHEEISILQSPFLHEADMGFTSVAQKKKWIEENYSPQIAKSQKMADFNGDGKIDAADLKVRTEKILTLKDTDGDGRFDASTTFADGFSDTVTGLAHSVTPIGGSVYTTIIPDVWKLTDTDGDGRADKKEILVHGFANHIGYGNHDLHCLVQGLDGKIYWSMGDRGTDVVSKEGHHFAYPHTGTIVRCNPDGSEFEVFASGLRNCQAFDFDNFGNLIAIDHDADFQGEKERLVYIPEGSDSGWRCYYQYRRLTGYYRSAPQGLYSPWLDEKMWVPFYKGQPSHILPPIENSWNAPAAFSFQPGTALGGKYRDHFLLGGLGSIRAFKMAPDGATFKREGEDLVVQGLNQQVLSSTVAPDGAMYFTLWDPRGGLSSLWRLKAAAPASTSAAQTKTLLANGLKTQGVAECLALLDHEDRRVRMAAQFELVARKDTGALQALALDEKAHLLPRLHSLWALGQLKHKDAGLLAKLCVSRDAEVRAQTARWAGDLGFDPDNIVPRLLADTSPRVQLFAAMSCGKLKSPGTLGALTALLISADNKVPVLRHAGVSGLVGVASEDELRAFATHPSEAMRIAALVALRRLGATGGMMAFLHDASAQVQSDAVRGIYDDGDAARFAKHPNALEGIAAKLDSPQPAAIHIRALAANRRLGTAVAAKRMAAFVANPEQDSALRVAGLDMLSSWSKPLTLDPVDGRHFPVPAFDANTLAAGLSEKVVSTLTHDADITVARRAIVIFSKMPPSEKNWTQAVGLVLDEKLDETVREEWLDYLRKQDAEKFATVAVQCLSAKSALLRESAAAHLLELKQGAQEVKDYLLRTLKEFPSPGEFQNAMKLLSGIPSPEPVMRGLVKELIAGKVARPVQLDILEAASGMAKRDDDLRVLLDEYRAAISKQGPLAEYNVALEGGNERGGRNLFTNNAALACSKCHALKKADQQVGPSLEGIGKRQTAAYLLESIIDPQAKIVPGYGLVTVELKDGRKVTGTLMAETDKGLSVKLTDGTIENYAPSTIQSKTKPIGAMPEVKALLNKKQIRDLVAFLQSL
ncbi:MAG: PQQ-dependent sugar dehydrogenase [Chthoniobacter sp.]|nr:PQQ-dependent sugar dehydrogenase [Chthoniobacter sp.]